MKVFVVIFAVIVFATVMGLLTYYMSGSEPAVAGSTDAMLGEDRMREADGMVSKLVISVIIAAVLGAAVVIFVLPKIAGIFANVVYDQSPEEYVAPTMVEQGRSLKMQEKFEDAIEMFRMAIKEEEPNREAWVEIAQIQEEEFEELEEALMTLKEGRDFHEWEMDDDVNFITRIATMEVEHFDRKEEAIALYHEMLDLYRENEYQASSAERALQALGVEV